MAEFAAGWGTVDVERSPGVIIAGHAHDRRAAVRRETSGSILAVDGEATIYRRLEAFAHGEVPAPDTMPGVPADWPGNIVRWDPAGAVLEIATEATGSFPVYARATAAGLVFASHQRPLARNLRLGPDPVGILSFLRTGFLPGRRSFFTGLERMQPGQRLRCRAGGEVHVEETSRLWASEVGERPDPEALERIWRLLADALTMRTGPGDRLALMLSAGWDSRTLLAGLGEIPRDRLLAYTHGDPASREPRLAAELAHRAGIHHLAFDLGPELYDPAFLQAEFARTEHVVFPHWIAAGRRLREAGAAVAWAGVYGEILGGHYGDAMARRGWRKALAVLAPLLGSRLGFRPARLGREDVSRLAIGSIAVPWYLDRRSHDLFREAARDLAGELEADLDRLTQRGIRAGSGLLEAFIAEHRGSQYINAQVLALRGSVDAGLPFTDPRLLEGVARIPLPARIHNRLNRTLLRRHAPQVLRLPGSATLLPLSAPLLLQEASRALRRVGEGAQWGLHHRAPSVVPPPRLSWVTLEFLRDGKALGEIVEDLRSDWWDRDALHRVLADHRAHAAGQSMHPISDQLLKIYTVDLMTR